MGFITSERMGGRLLNANSDEEVMSRKFCQELISSPRIPKRKRPQKGKGENDGEVSAWWEEFICPRRGGCA